MNRNNRTVYIETDSPSPKRASRILEPLSLAFGIASIALAGPFGIVLGGLAQRFADISLANCDSGSPSARARAGQITGSVGLCLSVVSVSIFLMTLITAVWLAIYKFG